MFINVDGYKIKLQFKYFNTNIVLLSNNKYELLYNLNTGKTLEFYPTSSSDCRSIIIEGLDGTGKSLMAQCLKLLNYYCIKKKIVNFEKNDFWWKKDSDYVNERFKAYLERNKCIIGPLALGPGQFIEKGMFTTIVTHSFFLTKDFKDFLDQYYFHCSSLRTFIVSCDENIRVQRLLSRPKLTSFDKFTLNDAFVKYYYDSQAYLLKRELGVCVINNNFSEDFFSAEVLRSVHYNETV